MRIIEPLNRREMRASEPFEPSSICKQVRGSRLVLGRRFGRRFVFGHFWSLLVVVWGVVLVVVSFLVVFGRFWASYGTSFCFGRFWSLLGVVWGVVLFWSFLVAFDAIDAFRWRD
jgi:hypothetical protein